MVCPGCTPATPAPEADDGESVVPLTFFKLRENGVIAAARIAPGCVFSTPDRVEKAEALIVGKAPSAALFEEAGKAVSEEMIARTGIRWSTEYKKPVIEALIQRALCRAAGLPED